MRSIEELEAFLATDCGPRERAEALLKLKVALLGSDFNRSHKLCLEALELCALIDDPLLLGNAHRHLANVLWRMGRSAEAQEQFGISLQIFREQKDSRGLAHVYCGLGIVHGSLNDMANGLEFFNLGLIEAKKANDVHTMADLLGNIGHIHLKLEDHVTALRHFAKSLAIYREMDEDGRHGVSNMLSSIAGVLVHQGEYANAVDHLEKAIAIDEEIGDNRSTAVRYLNLGITYFKMGDNDAAVMHLIRSLELGDSVNFKAVKHMVHEQLAEVYSAMGNAAGALEQMELYNACKVVETRMAVSKNAGNLL